MTFDDFKKKEEESRTTMNLFYEFKGWKFNRSYENKVYDLKINEFKVDEKFRYAAYNDFLIEIVQDVLTLNKGWFYKDEIDRIFYIINDAELYAIKWHDFKKWFSNNWQIIKLTPVISKQGWGLTFNIAIQWIEIPNNLYTKFDLLS